MSKKLTAKQEAFCVEYVRNGNVGIDAYRHAFDCKTASDKTITNKAYHMLQKGEVKARVEELQKQAVKKVEKTLGLDIVDVALMFKKIHDTAEKDSDKIKAAENLMKHLGGYKEDNNQKQTKIDIPNINFNGNKSE